MAEIPNMTGFIYIWRDAARGMYYVGSHLGVEDDGYVSSSRWLNGEVAYRPADFRRRILRRDVPEAELRAAEYAILAKIPPVEFGRRYYNIKPGRKPDVVYLTKTGRKPGSIPWNKGKKMPPEFGERISQQRRGRVAWNRGQSYEQGAINGRASAAKVSASALGRKMEVIDGRRRWVHTDEHGRYVNENGRKCYLPPVQTR